MKTIRYHVLIIFMIAVSISGCSRLSGLFGKKTYADAQFDNVEQLRLSYQSGNIQSLEELIAFYLDENQPFNVRVAAGRALAESHHPSALEAIASVVASADALDLSFMQASIEILAGFTEDPLAAEAMVQALHSIEEKNNQLHLSLVKSLGKVRTKDQVLSLLDLYALSQANLIRTENLLAETLGNLGDDQVIPVLTSIARDPSVSLAVRNRAVEILGKKETTDVVGSFAELLGDPSTMAEVRDFALNTMAGVKEEKLILALLETYKAGKNEYYSLLNTLLDALGEFEDPEIKAAVVEIIKNDEYPVSLREKAIRGIARFNDPTMVPALIDLLKKPDNYHLYDPIMEVVVHFDQDGSQRELIRRLAYSAHGGGSADE